MAILIIGGAGKTGLPLAHVLKSNGVPFLLASRRGQSAASEGMNAATFDWLDPSTFDAPFTHPSLGSNKIKAIYLIGPVIEDATDCMTNFIQHAASKHGVKRFVMMAGSNVEIGGADVGKVWQYIVEKGYEWAMLQATWFAENYSQDADKYTIIAESKIYSACGDGKIPFISVEDIAACAYKVLTDQKPHNKSYLLLGPGLLTVDEAAIVISKYLNRPIDIARLSPNEFKDVLVTAAGMLAWLAEVLAWLNEETAKGSEEKKFKERTDDAVEVLTGKKGRTFEEVVEREMSRGAWDA